MARAGRPSGVRKSVNGLPLREYLIRALVSSSYRKLVLNKQFKLATGINSLGNLQHICKSYKIDMEEVYKYAKENRMISQDESFEEWTTRTREGNYCANPKKKGKSGVSKSEIYVKMGETIGLQLDKGMDEDVLVLTLKDFMTESDFTKLFGKVEKELTK